MKPKIALAKYLDWAVLAVLAAALIFVAVWSFLLKATREEKRSEEISKYDRDVRNWMSDTSAQPQPRRDYLSELQDSFEHVPVIDSYRHNPFLAREDKPYPPLQLRVGMPYSVNFKSARFTQVVSSDEKYVHVNLAYDLLTGVSTVTFTPVAEGEATIRIQTDEDLVHLFKISVRTVKRPLPPNPPINVAVVPRAVVEIRKTLQPAMVLISFTPNNDPREPGQTVGSSNSAAVYRKPAGASDAEYGRLDDPSQPLVPLDREHIHEIMLKFQIPETAADQPAPATPAAPTGPGPSGPPVPEVASDDAFLRAKPGDRAERTGGEPAPGSFVFLDQTVDDGERYTYKIVTLSTASEPGVEPVPCEDPYVHEPVFVPSLVEFTVRTITHERVTVGVTRRDPDTGMLLTTQNFTVGIGMKIGGMVTLKLPEVVGMPPSSKNVDFSTGCILVSALPAFQTVEYNKLQRFLHLGDTYTPDYQARDIRDPRILYLTPRGALRFKSKEKEVGAAVPLTREEPGGTRERMLNPRFPR
jgi:hypothetical protein